MSSEQVCYMHNRLFRCCKHTIIEGAIEQVQVTLVHHVFLVAGIIVPNKYIVLAKGSPLCSLDPQSLTFFGPLI